MSTVVLPGHHYDLNKTDQGENNILISSAIGLLCDSMKLN